MNNVTVNTNTTSNQVFNFGDYQVRTVIKEGEPWFVAKDVCSVLELTNNREAISRLDEDEKGVNTVYTLGGNQNLTTINESGLYSLILTSRKPEAKAFKKWVTSEVLPSIRKQGKYEVKPTVPQSYSQALLEAGRLAAIVEQQELLMQQQELLMQQQELLMQEQKEALILAAPKIEYVDNFVERGNNRSLTDVAKELEISAKELGRWLRQEGHAWKNKTPLRWKQTFIDNGYGSQKLFSNENVNVSQALVTPEGDIFIKENYKSKE